MDYFSTVENMVILGQFLDFLEAIFDTNCSKQRQIVFKDLALCAIAIAATPTADHVDKQAK